jgi:hypothetical protein
MRTSLDRLGDALAKDPAPPFDDLADYYSRVDLAVHEAKESDDEDLRALADSWRAKARAEDKVAPRAIEALRGFWAGCQREHDAAGNDVAKLRAIAERLALASQGRDCLLAEYPGRQAEIEAAMPQSASTTTSERITTATRIGTVTGAIASTRALVDGIATVEQWSKQAPTIDSALQLHRTEVDGLGDLGAAARRALDDLSRLCGDRGKAADDVTRALIAFAGGRLDLRGQLEPARRVWPNEAESATAAASAASAAFAALRQTGDCDAAARELQAARAALLRVSSATGAIARVDIWLDKLEALRSATIGLVQIPGSTVRTTGGAVEVDAFYLSPLEVTRKQWLPFLVELDRVWTGTAGQAADARLLQVAGEFGVRVPEERVVRDLLRRRTALQDDSEARASEPIDEVSQFGAAMFAHWQKRSLPVLAEWALAALGPAATSRAFPWGDEWTNDREVRNIGRALQRADEGGRTSSDRRLAAVRHLVGNVAEWLEAEGSATEGLLAGGGCTDTLLELQAAAGGKARRERRTAFEVAYGLRTIVRPRTFFGTAWPADP